MAKITFLDDCGFAVRTPNVLLVFDYYRDPMHYVTNVLRQEPDLPVVFFVSNKHQHHYNHQIFNMAQDHKRVYILANDVPGISDTEIPYAVMTGGDVIEDVLGGLTVRAYRSNEAGVAYVVTDKAGTVYFHGGDLSKAHYDENLDPRNVEKTANAYTTTIKRIAADNPHINVAFLAVDRRTGDAAMTGAAEFINTVRPEHFIAMHDHGAEARECRFTLYGMDADSTTRVHCAEEPGQSFSIKEAVAV